MNQQSEKVFLEKYAAVARHISLQKAEKEAIRARLVAEIKDGPVKIFSIEETEMDFFDRFSAAMRRLVAGA